MGIAFVAGGTTFSFLGGSHPAAHVAASPTIATMVQPDPNAADFGTPPSREPIVATGQPAVVAPVRSAGPNVADFGTPPSREPIVITARPSGHDAGGFIARPDVERPGSPVLDR